MDPFFVFSVAFKVFLFVFKSPSALVAATLSCCEDPKDFVYSKLPTTLHQDGGEKMMTVFFFVFFFISLRIQHPIH